MNREGAAFDIWFVRTQAQEVPRKKFAVKLKDVATALFPCSGKKLVYCHLFLFIWCGRTQAALHCNGVCSIDSVDFHECTSYALWLLLVFSDRFYLQTSFHSSESESPYCMVGIANDN